MQKATAATGFLRNWSKLTGSALGFTFGVVISGMVVVVVGCIRIRVNLKPKRIVMLELRACLGLTKTKTKFRQYLERN
jgi:hypothetical protein